MPVRRAFELEGSLILKLSEEANHVTVSKTYILTAHAISSGYVPFQMLGNITSNMQFPNGNRLETLFS
jgi:hypothetical protein